jgi:hypothetical protein
MFSMSRAHPRRRLPWFAALALAGVAGSLVLASSAMAAPTVTRATPGNGEFWNTSPVYNVSGDGTVTLSSTVGTLSVPSVDGSGSVTIGDVPGGPLTPGTLTATDSTGPTAVDFAVDTVAPTLGTGLAPAAPNGQSGWYVSPVTIGWTCSDPGGSGIAACPANEVISAQGPGPIRPGQQALDLAGNLSAPVDSLPFKIDSVAPPASQLLDPPSGSEFAALPSAFRWVQQGEALPGSGLGSYVVQWRQANVGDWQQMATGNSVAGDNVSNPSVSLPDAWKGKELEWRVVTSDHAGNSSPSSGVPYRFTVDPTVPPAPVITGGPSAPIRFTSPTFSWSGTQETYLWDLFIPGRSNPVRSGGGPATETTLQSLGDGNYTFRVIQVTAFGVRSEGATRSFAVDTTPPVAPQITVRPPFPASGVITFGWTTEPGAFSRWQIVGAGGAVAIGPSDTPLNSVSIANLADGAYSFQVLQIDPAGNASATTAEPFTVTTPLAPGQSTTAPRVQPAFLLPTQNAFRLRPKAGKTLPTRRPVLRWRRGPRGTRLYNVQIFKVVKKRRGAAPTVKKVYSGFPSKRQLRAPKSKMQPGTCYVWRVWPYTGTRFTPKPLGISNFCVAKASVLKKKAAQAAARKAARRAR